MAVPEFQSFMLPILKLFSDEKEHTANECIRIVIKHFDLNEEDINLTIPSGKQTLVANRVYWSLTYLKKALLLNSTKKGIYTITERGKQLLNTNPDRIDKKTLFQYEEYKNFINQEKEESNQKNEYDNKNNDMTPEEKISLIYNEINNKLADDLLEIILDIDPFDFEELVMDVITKMGYGNKKENHNIVTKKSGDGGIDGIINQDRLGLDKIYIQAKRWNGPVGRPELQQFSGTLLEKKSEKGIFITTSDFSKQARDYVSNLKQSIILINGEELARFMIEYNIGVQSSYLYETKKIDYDYFNNNQYQINN